MKHPEKTPASSSPGSLPKVEGTDKSIPKKPEKKPRGATVDNTEKVDRPGFDLGGSSGKTHAGTGLGLGENAAETPGNRRLPGRRFENKLTIPRWSGPEPRGTTEPAKDPSDGKTSSAPQTKKSRLPGVE